MKLLKVIGTGAAGNKGLACLIRKKLLNINEAIIVNSTDRDVPDEFKEMLINIGDGRGGCGKERSLGTELANESLNGGDLQKSIEMLIEDDDETVVIVTSAEGGTGCGSTPPIIDYCLDMELNVQLIIFEGFENDARGIANTLDLYKDINKNITVHIIRNSMFLEEAKGSYVVAEQLANEELCRLYEAISGCRITNSFQNMDETDLYNVVNYPGYSVAKMIDLGRTTMDQSAIDNAIKKSLGELKTYKNENGKCRMLGVVLGLSDPTIAIDRKFSVLRDFFGNPYTDFVHIQKAEDEQFISFIVSGMDMPMKEIECMYDRYQKEMSSIKKGEDTFFERKDTIKTNSEEFDFASKRRGRGRRQQHVEIPPVKSNESKSIKLSKEVFEQKM